MYNVAMYMCGWIKKSVDHIFFGKIFQKINFCQNLFFVKYFYSERSRPRFALKLGQKRKKMDKKKKVKFQEKKSRKKIGCLFR